MPPTVGSVVINANDVEPIVAFWKALLEVEEASRFPGFVFLRPQHEGGVSVAVQHVPEGKQTERNRVHVDLGVEDLEAASAHALELGATQVEEHSIGDFTWRVFQDPGGNEFCLAQH